ncbi:MAG: succinate dehydrogenase cytochrome b subunit [Zetaproteobacteria bacterium]|nr:succinate dehydrogenase cytochrome b subunit [Zetaproteobacteria bacterium]
MGWATRALGSSVGCKLIMALTGLMLVGFIVAHLAGNLLVFAGPAALNAYAKGLHDLGGLLWVARGGLLVGFLLHIFTGKRLIQLESAAKPVKYKVAARVKASFASRYMALSGVTVLVFFFYHLAHFTFRYTHAQEFAHLGAFDVYAMMILSFRSPILSLFYCASIFFLTLHLNHGLQSLLQTLGFNHPKYDVLNQKILPALGILLGLGFISIPVAVLLGAVS